jgi:hypothetical protein
MNLTLATCACASYVPATPKKRIDTHMSDMHANTNAFPAYSRAHACKTNKPAVPNSYESASAHTCKLCKINHFLVVEHDGREDREEPQIASEQSTSEPVFGGWA